MPLSYFWKKKSSKGKDEVPDKYRCSIADRFMKYTLRPHIESIFVLFNKYIFTYALNHKHENFYHRNHHSYITRNKGQFQPESLLRRKNEHLGGIPSFQHKFHVCGKDFLLCRLVLNGLLFIFPHACFMRAQSFRGHKYQISQAITQKNNDQK